MLDDAQGEVARGLECVEFACGIPHLLKGAHSSEVSAGIDVHTVLQPVGVVAGITPFNFPVMVPLWMLANALACGNAFVLQAVGEGPVGVAVPGRAGAARPASPTASSTSCRATPKRSNALLTHPDVDAVSFVGQHRRSPATSTRPAREHGKRVQALGGAKNHMVVLPDADIDAAADAAISAAYGSAGERCMAISVVVAVGPSPTRWSRRSRPHPRRRGRSRRRRRVDDGPADHRRAPRPRALLRRRRRRRGRAGRRRRLRLDAGGRDGFFLGCSLLDSVAAGHAPSTTTRSSGRC